jgi:hypothetical protein
MSVAGDSVKARVGWLVILGGLMVFIDTLWGALLVLVFDWNDPKQVVFGMSLVSGLPAYVLDFRRRGRVVVFLLSAVLLRAFVEFFLAGSSTPGRPWAGNLNVSALEEFVIFPPSSLLIAATMLLQWSKLRNRGVITGL